MAILLTGLQLSVPAQTGSKESTVDKAIYQSEAFSVYSNRVEQQGFRAVAVSPFEMNSDYKSPDADKYTPDITFKFSINLRDNEMAPGKNHQLTLIPEKGKVVTNVTFGKQLAQTIPLSPNVNLEKGTKWNIRLDMREVFKAFDTKGYYTLFNGERLEKGDFKGVYIAGDKAPLMWDFNNLHNRAELELKDPDGDHIYETTLLLNVPADVKLTDTQWKKSRNTDAFPQYKSDYLISDAIYNLSLEEMIRAVEPDSTFRTGKEWSGVWTRDISYSIILSMAHLQPQVSINSLMRKVSPAKRIIQDTGTGGAWPNSTDRMIWATAAWEVYKATGNHEWLEQAYTIIKNSLEDDLQNVYDPITGLVKGESSFLDWREQTYPLWMQPADIFESECLGTNAAHYQANIVLAEMAVVLDHQSVAAKHRAIAERIKAGINQYLWIPEKNYYAQFLYGRNFKIVSPRSEALGEALCVIFGIADKERAQKLVANTPVTAYGIPCIWPQIPGIPPYHNNGIWPFVQSFWLWAGASANNEQSVLESISAIYRPAAMFLTNKENFVAENGDFSGTQINSSIMLWSLSGNLSLVHKVLFGIRFEPNSMSFSPFVPEALKGARTLTNFTYRKAILDIELVGFGSRITSFQLDGTESSTITLPGNLEGKHTLRIQLDNTSPAAAATNQVPVLFSLPAPEVQIKDNSLIWPPVEHAIAYKILRNGVPVGMIKPTSIPLDGSGANEPYAQYQVIAVDHQGIESFASEPVPIMDSDKGNIQINRTIQILQAEEFAPKANQPYSGASEGGFVEISRSINRIIDFPIEIAAEGLYSIDFRYSNGNGPTNTENKCAIRTLKVDGVPVNAVIFPQRGKEEWSNWGLSSALQVYMPAGKHTLTLSFEPANENMHGEINQAMIDYMRVVLIKPGKD